MRTILASILLCTACSTQNVTSVAAPVYSLEQAQDSVPLFMNRETRIGDIWFTLADVQDSRCPSDVTCVWEGDGVAVIQADPPCIKQGCKAASARLELHTNLEPKAGNYWGARIRLVGLRPYPSASNPADRAKYVAWVQVTAIR